MKLQLPKEDDGFRVVPQKICGTDCYLITPNIDVVWSENNLIFRSVVVDTNGNVLSSGFKKFFNLDEKPSCYPNPRNFRDWIVEEKIDGSTVIVSYINGQINMRTRGTVSYETQENAKDFELLLEQHPQIKTFLTENTHTSLLFEIVTPNNVIVLRPDKIKFYFLAAIDNTTLQMVNSHQLTEIWRRLGCPLTPKRYQFDDLEDILKIYNHIKQWTGTEGIVVTYNNGQNKVKLKTDWYNWIHKIKSELNSEKNLIELYVDSGMPDAKLFFDQIEQRADYELARGLQSEIDRICVIGDKVKYDIENMKEFVSSIRGFKNRKEQAEHVITSYSDRSSFVFSLLDKSQLSKDQLFKMMIKQLNC